VQPVSMPVLVAPPLHWVHVPDTQTPLTLPIEQAAPVVQGVEPSPPSALESMMELESLASSPVVESPVSAAESAPSELDPPVSALESLPSAGAVSEVESPPESLELEVESVASWLFSESVVESRAPLELPSRSPVESTPESSGDVPNEESPLPHPLTFATTQHPTNVLAVSQDLKKPNERMGTPSAIACDTLARGSETTTPIADDTRTAARRGSRVERQSVRGVSPRMEPCSNLST
jgi:hypothetical protein